MMKLKAGLKRALRLIQQISFCLLCFIETYLFALQRAHTPGDWLDQPTTTILSSRQYVKHPAPKTTKTPKRTLTPAT